jgi:hypothetical protein
VAAGRVATTTVAPTRVTAATTTVALTISPTVNTPKVC